MTRLTPDQQHEELREALNGFQAQWNELGDKATVQADWFVILDAARAWWSISDGSAVRRIADVLHRYAWQRQPDLLAEKILDALRDAMPDGET